MSDTQSVATLKDDVKSALDQQFDFQQIDCWKVGFLYEIGVDQNINLQVPKTSKLDDFERGHLFRLFLTWLTTRTSTSDGIPINDLQKEFLAKGIVWMRGAIVGEGADESGFYLVIVSGPVGEIFRKLVPEGTDLKPVRVGDQVPQWFYNKYGSDYATFTSSREDVASTFRSDFENNFLRLKFPHNKKDVLLEVTEYCRTRVIRERSECNSVLLKQRVQTKSKPAAQTNNPLPTVDKGSQSVATVQVRKDTQDFARIYSAPLPDCWEAGFLLSLGPPNVAADSKIDWTGSKELGFFDDGYVFGRFVTGLQGRDDVHGISNYHKHSGFLSYGILEVTDHEASDQIPTFLVLNWVVNFLEHYMGSRVMKPAYTGTFIKEFGQALGGAYARYGSASIVETVLEHKFVLVQLSETELVALYNIIQYCKTRVRYRKSGCRTVLFKSVNKPLLNAHSMSALIKNLPLTDDKRSQTLRTEPGSFTNEQPEGIEKLYSSTKPNCWEVGFISALSTETPPAQATPRSDGALTDSHFDEGYRFGKFFTQVATENLFGPSQRTITHDEIRTGLLPLGVYFDRVEVNTNPPNPTVTVIVLNVIAAIFRKLYDINPEHKVPGDSVGQDQLEILKKAYELYEDINPVTTTPTYLSHGAIYILGEKFSVLYCYPEQLDTLRDIILYYQAQLRNLPENCFRYYGPAISVPHATPASAPASAPSTRPATTPATTTAAPPNSPAAPPNPPASAPAPAPATRPAPAPATTPAPATPRGPPVGANAAPKQVSFEKLLPQLFQNNPPNCWQIGFLDTLQHEKRSFYQQTVGNILGYARDEIQDFKEGMKLANLFINVAIPEIAITNALSSYNSDWASYGVLVQKNTNMWTMLECIADAFQALCKVLVASWPFETQADIGTQKKVITQEFEVLQAHAQLKYKKYNYPDKEGFNKVVQQQFRSEKEVKPLTKDQERILQRVAAYYMEKASSLKANSCSKTHEKPASLNSDKVSSGPARASTTLPQPVIPPFTNETHRDQATPKLIPPNSQAPNIPRQQLGPITQTHVLEVLQGFTNAKTGHLVQSSTSYKLNVFRALYVKPVDITNMPLLFQAEPHSDYSRLKALAVRPKSVPQQAQNMGLRLPCYVLNGKDCKTPEDKGSTTREWMHGLFNMGLSHTLSGHAASFLCDDTTYTQDELATFAKQLGLDYRRNEPNATLCKRIQAALLSKT